MKKGNWPQTHVTSYEEREMTSNRWRAMKKGKLPLTGDELWRKKNDHYWWRAMKKEKWPLTGNELWRKKWLLTLKGQCHEIFCFWFFSWISFPPAPEPQTVSNFFENSRRYSQLKVCHRYQQHRWQMEKIFNQKNFNNFVWSPLGIRGNIYIHFCLQVHFQMSAAWYCSHYLPPVSMTPVANLPAVLLIPVAICHRRHWHRRQICRRYRWRRWQICHRCQQHKGNWWQN